MGDRLTLRTYFDGSCGPRNPGGVAAYGFLIRDEAGDIIHSSSGRLGSGPEFTNNVAEFGALYQAMLWVHHHYPEAHVVFYGDSSLVVAIMRGEARAQKGKYLAYYQKTIQLAKPYLAKQQWRFQWIQRALNHEADELAQYYRF